MREKYKYTTAQTKDWELIGSHITVARIKKWQALELAQQLIASVANEEDEEIRVHFQMDEPTREGDFPTVRLGFGHMNTVEAELHWAVIEGHELFVLDHEEMN